MIEIELKALIPDRKSLNAKLEAGYQLVASIEKSDIYYKQPSPGPNLRIRSKQRGEHDEQCLMTVKHKQVIDGIELSKEVEMQVEGRDQAVALVTALGFLEIQRKHKHSLVYKNSKHPELSIELNDVQSLGTYLELEVVLPEDSSEEAKAQAQALLKDTLTALSISHDRIEARSYMQLLRERQGS